jgi:hypothetical protein
LTGSLVSAPAKTTNVFPPPKSTFMGPVAPPPFGKSTSNATQPALSPLSPGPIIVTGLGSPASTFRPQTFDF